MQVECGNLVEKLLDRLLRRSTLRETVHRVKNNIRLLGECLLLDFLRERFRGSANSSNFRQEITSFFKSKTPKGASSKIISQN